MLRLNLFEKNMRSLFVRLFFFIALIPVANTLIASDQNTPYLYVLGVTQDAGYPQAGCYKPHCLPAWQDADLRQNAVSMG